MTAGRILGLLQSAELRRLAPRLTFVSEVFLPFALPSYKPLPAQSPERASCDWTPIVLPKGQRGWRLDLSLF